MGLVRNPLKIVVIHRSRSTQGGRGGAILRGRLTPSNVRFLRSLGYTVHHNGRR
jgi:hypothetical protein